MFLELLMEIWIDCKVMLVVFYLDTTYISLLLTLPAEYKMHVCSPFILSTVLFIWLSVFHVKVFSCYDAFI